MSLALVFLLLSKAFESIYYRILLHKLAIVGDSPIVVKWFESYLSVRNQVVRIGFSLSLQRPVTRVKCSQVNTSQPGKEKYSNCGENRTHDLDVASVRLYQLNYAVQVRVVHVNYDI